jgi:hypothetical protein
MTQAELVQMLISKCNAQAEQIKCLKIDCEDWQKQINYWKADVRSRDMALQSAKGGMQVRKQNQSVVESLRDAVMGLLTAPEDQRGTAITFANKIMSLTETEVSF